MRIADDLREKVFAAYTAGQTINQVAQALLKKNWARAKKLNAEWQAEQGGGLPAALDLARPGTASEESEDWDLTIKVPTSKLEEILGLFSPAEKATAIQSVLQIRIDTALGIES